MASSFKSHTWVVKPKEKEGPKEKAKPPPKEPAAPCPYDYWIVEYSKLDHTVQGCHTLEQSSMQAARAAFKRWQWKQPTRYEYAVVRRLREDPPHVRPEPYDEDAIQEVE